MKRVIYLFMIMLAIGAMCPSCGGDDTSTPDFDYEPIKPDLGDDEEDEGKDEESEEDAPDQNEEFKIEIANWNFEEVVDFTGEKGAWIQQAGWNGQNAVVTYEPNGGYKSSGGIKIECINPNSSTDMPVSQTVTGLIPDKLYELSAMIKVKGITKTNGRGGNIGLYGHQVWTSSDPFNGSHDWEKRSVKFIADKETIDIACRLGFTAGDSNGTAWFDEVKLESPTNMYHRESKHVVLYVEKELVNISNNLIDKWLAKLDDIYEQYTQLFDFFVPFEGKKMIILSGVIDAWAYAGYPIQWNRDYITPTFTEIQNYDNTCFGIMHEMGHNFAPGNYRTGKYAMGNYDAWNWNEELFANFRMYYGLYHTNHPTYINNQTYFGKDIIGMYKEQYDKSLAVGKADGGDGLMYVMCKMVDDYGWEPFKKTFKELYELDPDICLGEKEQRWPKIENFFIVLSKHADTKNILAEYLTTDQINLLKTL